MEPNVDFENLEISFSCASSYPYAREDHETKRYFVERLICNDEAVDLTRLNGGASVLKNHDTNIVLGRIVRAWIEGEVLCVRIRFRTDNMSRDLFADLANGTVPNVSIGYTVEHYNEYTDEAGNLVRDVDKWTAYEVSVCVGIPADPTVGFYRNFELDHARNNKQLNKEATMAKRADETPKETEMSPDEMKARIAELESENEALKKACDDGKRECCDKPEDGTENKGCGGEADKETRSMVLELKRRIDSMTPANNRSLVVPNIKTSGEREYNIANVLTALVGGEADISFERERSAELYESMNMRPSRTSIMVPLDGFRSVLEDRINRREMNSMSGSAPGLVAQQNLPTMFIDYVRTRIGVKNATFIAGLTGGPVTIPVQTSEAQVAWISGTTASPGTNQAVSSTTVQVGDITLTPHKLGAYVPIGLDLLLQGNPSATNIAVTSLMNAVARKLGTTMLKGNASDPTITGLATATGVQTAVIANIASATWNQITNLIGKVEGLEYNGPQEFVMSAGDKATFKSIAKGNYGSGFICEDGFIDGRYVNVDGSLSSGDIYYGDFSNIYVGQWGGIELMLDPYTQSLSGTVNVIVRLVCDIGIARPNTFVKRVAS
jgi:HK97 family phage major capsid protein/HK97 family phage prohead protease